MEPPALEVVGLAKSFGATRALADASFAVAPGTVHGLVGENGAGKSTFIKCLAGLYRPDAGEIRVGGSPVRFDTPQAAAAQGLSFVHQELSLVPFFDAAENAFLGHPHPTRMGLVDRPAMRRALAAALAEIAPELPLDRPVKHLTIGERQIVEIGRALLGSPRLIVMDEPTAALGLREVERLHAILAEMKADGVGIVFVGHRLDEVMTVCDRYTVLRDGAVAGSGAVGETTIDGLVRLMIGRDLAPVPSEVAMPGPVVLAVRGLHLAGASGSGHRRTVSDVGFAVRAGEILGFAGLVGSGRSEIARALFGADPLGAGTIHLEGREVVIASPREAIALGIGLVPEDRKQQSLFPGLSVIDNFGMAGLGGFAGAFGWMSARDASAFMGFRAPLGIRTADGRQDIATLSGGNQQKVVLARWLATRPKVLIVDEPTRGIDIAAKADVHRLVRELAASGVAIILISSDLGEILALSHRILTLRAGRVTGEIPAPQASEEILMRLMALEPAQAA